MSEKRRLQQDIEKTLKKVDDGILDFKDLCEKFHSSDSQTQKEKLENELKREIKKLQRFRDTIKTWQTSSDVKDKIPLEEARKRIEKEMEHFKLCEKETKVKAFSKEGLAAKAKVDPQEEGRSRHREWLNEYIDKINTAIDTYEAEQETLTKKGKSKNPARSLLLLKWIGSHQFHVQKLQQVLRRLDNDTIVMSQLDELNENIQNYMDLVEQCDTVFGEEIYADFHLDEGIEEIYGPIETHTNEEKTESVTESVKDKLEDTTRTDEIKQMAITTTSLQRNKGNSTGSGRALGGSPSHEPSPTTPRIEEAGASYASITSVGVRSEDHGKERFAATSSTSSILSKGTAEDAAKAKNSLSTFTTTTYHQKTEGCMDDTTGGERLQATHAAEGSFTDGSEEEGSVGEATSDAWHDEESQAEGVNFPQNEKRMDAATKEGEGSLLRKQLSASFSPQMGAEAHSSNGRGERSGVTEESRDEDAVLVISSKMMPPFLKEGDAGASMKEGASDDRLHTSSLPGPEGEGYVADKPFSLQHAGSSPPLTSPPLREGLRGAVGTGMQGFHGEGYMGRNSAPPGTISNPPNGEPETPGVPPLQGIVTAPPVGRRPAENLPVEEDTAFNHLAWLEEQLRISYTNSPTKADCDRRRHHIPRVPWTHPHPSFPLNPSINFDSPKFFERLNVETLFFVFYYQPGTYQQYLAARELKKKSWRFHKQLFAWFQRHEEPRIATETSERGSYLYFDYKTDWCSRVETDFLFEYIWLENEPFD